MTFSVAGDTAEVFARDIKLEEMYSDTSSFRTYGLRSPSVVCKQPHRASDTGAFFGLTVIARARLAQLPTFH